jgi:hypothetical protein
VSGPSGELGTEESGESSGLVVAGGLDWGAEDLDEKKVGLVGGFSSVAFLTSVVDCDLMTFLGNGMELFWRIALYGIG